MKRFEQGKSTAFALIASFLLLAGLILKTSTPVSATYWYPTPTPSCGTYTYTFDNDSNNGKVDVDFESNNTQIDVDGQSGWTVTLVEVDEFYDAPNDGNNNDDANNWVTVGTGNLNNHNPNGIGYIDDVRVTVTKLCPTTSPTPRPASVDVCHKDGQGGNYSHITVSVHSVNDANGLNGHGNHGGDIWGPFTYNNVNYSGQGDYNGFNLTSCNPNSTPTPEPTVSGTPVPTVSGTPVPTIDPCDGECQTSTPIPTEIPTEEPTPVATPGLTEAGPPHRTDEVAGSVLGASTGQVLGASTMAKTGSFLENLYLAIMSLGGTITFKGLKNFKKKN